MAKTRCGKICCCVAMIHPGLLSGRIWSSAGQASDKETGSQEQTREDFARSATEEITVIHHEHSSKPLNLLG